MADKPMDGEIQGMGPGKPEDKPLTQEQLDKLRKGEGNGPA